jgi:hypothetical protein
MVSVVDNLPMGVAYQNSSPEICNEIGGTVTCTLGILSESMEKQILIIGKVLITSTENLDSTAIVSSNTHDPDPTNNISQEQTLVDADKPVVNWVSPVQNERTYITDKKIILLIASASDHAGNDQVDRVEFKYWDHINLQYVDIGTAITDPYQVEFDSDVLIPGEVYQMFVQAFDRAGNASDRERIFIERRSYIFLPLINRK